MTLSNTNPTSCAGQGVRVERSSPCYRPLSALGKTVGRFYLHDGSRVTLSHYHGWLEHHENTDSFYSGADVVALDLDSLRIARSINLAKKDHFLVKYSDSVQGYHDEGWALYIYANVTDLGVFYSDYDKYGDAIGRQFYQIDLPCRYQKYMPNPEGIGRGVYGALHTPTILVSKWVQSKRTKEREELDLLLADINESCDLSLSIIDLFKLKDRYLITRK